MSQKSIDHFMSLAKQYNYNRLSQRSHNTQSQHTSQLSRYGMSPLINNLILQNPSPSYYTPSDEVTAGLPLDDSIMGDLEYSASLIDAASTTNDSRSETPTLPIWYTPPYEPRIDPDGSRNRIVIRLSTFSHSTLLTLSQHFSIYHQTTTHPLDTTSRITAVLEAIGQKNLVPDNPPTFKDGWSRPRPQQTKSFDVYDRWFM